MFEKILFSTTWYFSECFNSNIIQTYTDQKYPTVSNDWDGRKHWFKDVVDRICCKANNRLLLHGDGHFDTSKRSSELRLALKKIISSGWFPPSPTSLNPREINIKTARRSSCNWSEGHIELINWQCRLCWFIHLRYLHLYTFYLQSFPSEYSSMYFGEL